MEYECIFFKTNHCFYIKNYSLFFPLNIRYYSQILLKSIFIDLILNLWLIYGVSYTAAPLSCPLSGWISDYPD